MTSPNDAELAAAWAFLEQEAPCEYATFLAEFERLKAKAAVFDVPDFMERGLLAVGEELTRLKARLAEAKYKRDRTQAILDQAIAQLVRIHGFLSPPDVKLLDGRMFEFNNPGIEHEMLRGLSDAIRKITDDLAALKRTKGET